MVGHVSMLYKLVAGMLLELLHSWQRRRGQRMTRTTKLSNKLMIFIFTALNLTKLTLKAILNIFFYYLILLDQ
jgi:hypothetical protein